MTNLFSKNIFGELCQRAAPNQYAHILDEDRKVNAQKFETAFYAKPDLRNVRPPEEPAKSEPATLDLESLVEQLQKSPELASALAALIAAQAPAK